MAEDFDLLISHVPSGGERRSSAVQAAFWDLCEECEGELRVRCRRWLDVGDGDEVEDCLRNAMLYAFDHLPAELPVKARAWLFIVVRNFCRDWHRNSRRHLSRAFGADSLEQMGDNLVQPVEEGIESELARRESYAALHAHVNRLPERLREVMVPYLKDFGYEEIAVQLGIREITVRKRAEEARALLRPLVQFGGGMPTREKTTPDASAARSLEGRRADGHSVPGYRPPAHAHVVRSLDGRRLAMPVLCFTADPPERLEQRSQTLEKYVAQHASGHVKHIELAELYLLQGRWSRSMALLGAVLAQCPHLGLLRVRLAAMHMRLGARDAAMGLLRTGAVLPATQVVAYFLQGALAYCEGDMEAAERHWQACRALNPHWAMPLHVLLGLAFYRGDLQRAVVLLDEGLAAFPDDRILYFWGCCLPAAPREGLQRAREAVRRFPADGVAALQLRRACLLAGVAVPSPSRPERRSRFEAVELDLQLLAAGRAGNLRLAATLGQGLAPDWAGGRAWREWLDAPVSGEFPASPWGEFAPVLPL